MMKKVLSLFIAASAVFSLQAQTLDEILNNYFANTGGIEKWKEVQGTKMEGVMSMQGMEFPGTITEKTPNKQRVDVNVQGKQIVQAYDGVTAWAINPFQGGETAQKMSADEAEQMTKTEFGSPFLNYKEKGHTAELIGKKTVEGAETFEVKLTKKNGDIEYYYFDAEAYVPIMVKTTIPTGPMKGQESETYYSDYQEVNGLIFPHFLESKIAGQTLQKITIKSIEVNGAYDDSLFAFPTK
jgi:outer membrane lipoprotein-sorting protein